MLLLVIASVVLPSVLGHCCFPEKFSGNVYYDQFTTGGSFSIDFKLKKLVLTPANSTSKKYTLTDFSTGDVFVRYLDGTCTKVTLPGESTLKACIPKNATFEGEGFFGPVKGGLAIKSFEYKVDGGDVIVDVAKDGCVPVATTSRVNGEVRNSIYESIVIEDSPNKALLVDTSDCIDNVDIIG